eukprot:CAMPEP_0182901926 /NCGR_PEP_ID=MMETSP0034_2-20130328/30063_1 /TAXON_ID=156128 /ORGANISM="Nephroselmis pyriformis, Strain CCMP717" /LENGTH=52 /DNA_ID=CAMNT_0025036463 /DNA_START=395 /DNA_END=553 /DNA_ORIENTATION=+
MTASRHMAQLGSRTTSTCLNPRSFTSSWASLEKLPPQTGRASASAIIESAST